jgi:hypothetical protein
VLALVIGSVVGLTVFPPPETMVEWFELFQRSRLVGILDFWGLEVPMYMAFVLVFLALYFALRGTSPGWMAVAMCFILVGSAIFLATNNPFTMLSLSRQYTAATTEVQRTVLLAAGEAVLAGTGQRAVGGFNVGLFLVSLAGLITGMAMLNSERFSRLMALLGVAAFALSLADYVRQMFTESVLIALLIILPNVVLLVVWFGMVARRQWQMAKRKG